MSDLAQERTEEATPRRKQEARRKGTVARSVDLTNACVLLALTIMLPWCIGPIASALLGLWRPSQFAPDGEFGVAEVVRHSVRTLTPALSALAPIVLTALIVGIGVNLAQVGFVASAESLQPQWERVNPVSGFKRLCSARSAVEGLKALGKAIIFGLLAYSALASEWQILTGLAWLTPAQATVAVGRIAHAMLWRVALAWLVIAAVDYWFQRKQTDKQLRMTKEEVKREHREQEQSPELRAEISARRRRLARSRMMDRVRTADVIITNPTHYAVALKYESSKMHAPIVVAKGVDYLAEKIREVAKKHRVAIIRNPPLARALHKQCEVGDFVPRELFRAVAEVLAYVYRTVRDVRG
jgi:flagellar biosynthetic protein FlhB